MTRIGACVDMTQAPVVSLKEKIMAVVQPFVVELNTRKEYQRLVDPDHQSRGMKSGRVYLEPGSACGQHSTEDREEVLVFLAGIGTLQIGHDQQFSVGSDKIAYIPPRTLHNVVNSGPVPLVYIFCVAPVTMHGLIHPPAGR
jgi:mannose-6-phosphate isomerase-like protein (cupin superfamily)